MQFSLENNNKSLENVYSILFKANTKEDEQRIRGRPRTFRKDDSITRSSTSLSQPVISPLVHMGLNDIQNVSANDINSIIAQTCEPKEKEQPVQDVIEMVLTGNRDKIQNKADFMNALKDISPEKLMEGFKTMGEKLFDKSEGQTGSATSSTSLKENSQLATPMPTPLDNVFLDETFVPVPLGGKEMDNTVMLPKTPASVNLLNMSFPSLDSTPSINTVIPSPDIFSPIQPNLNAIDLLTAAGKGCDIPALQPTPFEKPLDEIVAPSPMLDQESRIIAQDELNPFKSPAPVFDPMNLLAPSPIVSSPIDVLLDQAKAQVQSQVQSPAFALLNDGSVQTPSLDTTVSDILNSLTGTSSSTSAMSGLISQSPYQETVNEPLPISTPIADANSSFMQSPFAFPVASTPAIHDDALTAASLSDLLTGNNLLSATSTDENNGDALDMEGIQGSNLEQVDQLMKALLRNSEVLEKTTEVKTQDSDVSSPDGSFPSLDTIKNCMVSELEFDFTNENISKLVRLAPVEVVQEDVIALEKLAKQKRGKGRPRKPRKYSICPFTSCQKKFNREFNLKEHIRIHNPRRNKEFVCQWCQESFYSSSVLSRHVASIHEGEKFSCKNCGKKFNRKDALHRHEKISCHFNR